MLLKAPDGVGAVGWGGEECPVKDGVVDVPDAAAPVLLEQGFTPAPQKTENRKPKTGT